MQSSGIERILISMPDCPDCKRLREALLKIVRHPDAEVEPGEQNARRGAWEMAEIADAALSKDGGAG